MADPKIYIRRSASPNKVPTDTQLSLGELAVNTRDGKLYLKQDQTAVGLGSTVIAVNPWSVGVGTLAYNTYFTSGNVGVGTTNPTTKLQVGGVLGFGPGNNVRIGDNTTGATLTSGTNNFFAGVNAGKFTTSGRENVFIGNYAGFCNTSGRNNNFLGENSGCRNTNGNYNNFFGYQSGTFNISGDYNNFIGKYSGYRNTTGDNNNFLGLYAGYENTTGCRNNFLGAYAGCDNTTGFNNLFIGYRSGFLNTTGSYNIFLGLEAGCRNTTSSHSIAIGSSAGYYNEGDRNIYLGQNAGYLPGRINDVTGTDNIIMGCGSGARLTSGTNNFFAGKGAGYYNTDGSYNLFLGYYSGYNNSSGNNNTFVGRESGYSTVDALNNNFFGYYSAYSNLTGDNNNYYGSFTGLSTSASYNVIIGSGSGVTQRFDAPLLDTNAQLAIGLRTDANNSRYWLVGDENFNVGIGTTRPTTTLDVLGTVKASAFVGDGSGLTNIPSESFWINTSVGIHTLTNVGIGTTNPQSIFEVLGNSKFTGIVTVTGGINAPLYIDESEDDNNYYNIPFLDVATLGGDAYRLMQVDTGGLRFNPGANVFSVQNIQTPTTLLSLGSASGKYGIAIVDNGDVGIGTTNPLARLYVDGGVTVNGIVTAFSFSGNATSATYASTSGIATYATSSGVSTYASTSGIATYATSSGVSTYASTSGIATYATSSGVSTYASTAGIATYATNAGISTTLTATASVNTTGIITASTLDGNLNALGKTYYVATNGNNSNTGTNINRPFATLTYALSIATSGDTILVESGVFTETFPLTVPVGVTVRGKGLRATFIQPTEGTKTNDGFLLNGETTVEDLTIGNFFEPGYGFKFAPGMKTTTRSPYIQRVTVLNKGSITSSTDPYGFDTPHNPTSSYKAGRGILIDGGVVDPTTLEPAMLFNECTFICPNNTALEMTNGARTEWVNCFTYFADKGIYAYDGTVGLGSTGYVRVKTTGFSGTTPAANDELYYLEANPQTGTYAQVGTALSITKVGHGLTVGDRIFADFTSGTAADGFYRISSYVGINTFEITATSATTSGNVSYKEALGFGTVRSYDATTGLSSIRAKGEGLFELPTIRLGKTVTGYGDAQLSSSQEKFGTASLLLDGTGDYIQCEGGTDFSFAGNFTAECWIYPTSTTGTKYVFALGTETTGRYVVFLDGGVVKGNLFGQATTTFGGSISTNTWTHLAFVRSGSTITAYVNGTALGTTETNSSTIGNTGQLKVGADASGANTFVGYIDEVRISDTARYTGNFTTATAQFNSDGSDKLLLHFDGVTGSVSFIDSSIPKQDIRWVRSGVGIATATKITLADYQQFGAEMRSIGSAVVFGNSGITADGPGVGLRMFAFNFGHIGSGKDFSQDVSLVVQENEVIDTNNANVYFVSIDQSGDFRVGDAFYVNQELGTVNFGGQEFTINSLSDLNVTDGTNTSTLTPTTLTVGNIQISGNDVTTTSGDIIINPSGISSTRIEGDLTVTGTLNYSLVSGLDGDKGDITVSNNFATWTIDTNAVNLNKIENINTGTILGRTASGVGTVQQLPTTGSGNVVLSTGPSVSNLNASGVSILGIVNSDNIFSTGIITATSFKKSGGTSSEFLKADGSVDSNTYLTTTGSGVNLTGIVTSIVAGTNITISGSTGEVTINSTASGGSGSQWVTTSAGIHTLSNVGIGTTNPTASLEVRPISTSTFVGLFTGSTTTDLIRITQDGTGNALRVDDQAGGTTPFIVDNGGKVGINTQTATSNLTVFGSSRVTGISTSQYLDGAPINTLTGSILALSYGMAMP